MEQVPEGFEPRVLFSIRLFCALAHFINNSRYRVFVWLPSRAGNLRQCSTGSRVAVWAEVVKAQSGNCTDKVDIGFNSSGLGIFRAN
jgi:hypothetical protein